MRLAIKCTYQKIANNQAEDFQADADNSALPLQRNGGHAKIINWKMQHCQARVSGRGVWPICTRETGN
jgi:hypothetical protein